MHLPQISRPMTTSHYPSLASCIAACNPLTLLTCSPASTASTVSPHSTPVSAPTLTKLRVRTHQSAAATFHSLPTPQHATFTIDQLQHVNPPRPSLTEKALSPPFPSQFRHHELPLPCPLYILPASGAGGFGTFSQALPSPLGRHSRGADAGPDSPQAGLHLGLKRLCSCWVWGEKQDGAFSSRGFEDAYSRMDLSGRRSWELILGAKVLEMFLGFSCLDAEKRGGLAELCMGICYLPYTAWTNACSGTGRYSTARSPEVSVRKHISAC